MTKIKLIPLIVILVLLATTHVISEDEDEQTWYDYNSMYIRYGYQMHDQGQIDIYRPFKKIGIRALIDDFMGGRGSAFHPSRFWEIAGSNSSNIQFMYASGIMPPNRTLFGHAKKEIEDNTCITLTEITKTEDRHCGSKGQTDFICVYGEKGTCAGEYGRNLTKPSLFSITSNCGKRGALHEMGHILGLQNTQARSDRSKYLTIMYKNLGTLDDVLRRVILSEHQLCTDTPPEEQKMPYDFASVMQTGLLQWSENDQLILLPDDPRHLYMIDSAQNSPHFSHYDLWLLNLKYKCDEKFGEKCSSKKCENFGYLAKNCTCICPKGTSGPTCSITSTSTDVYDIPETPTCYKEVTAKEYTFTFKEIGIGQAKAEPFTQNCVIVVNSPSCQLPLITIDTRVAMQALKPKAKLWFENDDLSCSYFSLFYNVTGAQTRNICWDQLFDAQFYGIFSRRSKMWIFARTEDQELAEIAGDLKIHIHTTGDYRCKLGKNGIFDGDNSARMRSVGGAGQSATAMAVVLPVVAILVFIGLGVVYWKFIRAPMSEDESPEEAAQPPAESEDVAQGADDDAAEDVAAD